MSRRHGAGAFLTDRSKTRPTKELLKIFWGYLGDMKLLLGLISAIIVVITVGNVYQPIIISQGIDNTFANPTSESILRVILIYLVIAASVWLLQGINTWLTAKLSTSMVDKVRKAAFENLVDADMLYHHTNQSGDITSRAVNDTQEVASGLQVFTTTSSQLLLVIATFSILVSINIYFALIALLALPVAFLITKFFSGVGKDKMLKVRKSYGMVSGKLAENLSGVAIAKSFNQEEQTSIEIEKLNNQTYNYMKQLGIVFMLIFPSISFVALILVFGVLLFGGYLYTIPASALTVGSIYLGTVMVTRFLQPIIMLSNNTVQLQASLAAFDRVVDVLQAQQSVTDKPDATPLRLTTAEITVENVSFAYKKGEPVLHNVSFSIPSGKKVALIGHTGSGKTTLARLLMRFYDPLEGRIIIDGQDLRNVTLKSLNDAISIISQEPYLFADTVLENIRYGKPSASDEDVYKICGLIGADVFIDALPEGYLTKLTESGKSLSAGQRQMITIARTMLSDPQILILDEATSRLDAYSESLVQQAQNMLFADRTTLIIAHRLSTIRNVDTIVVLQDGILQESGTHEALIAKNGVYTELYNTYYSHQGLDMLVAD